jgi:hypothetical protein
MVMVILLPIIMAVQNLHNQIMENDHLVIQRLYLQHRDHRNAQEQLPRMMGQQMADPAKSMNIM